MSTKVFTIDGEINVDNTQAINSINETSISGESGAKKLASSLGNIATTAVKIGTVVAGMAAAIGGAVIASAKDTSKLADTIDKTSQKMGVSTTYFQELQYASEQCGVSLNNLQLASKKLEGTDLNLEDAINQIMALGSEEERTQKATELFGKTVAYNLEPILKQSSEEFSSLMERANELGIVMGEQAVKDGVAFGDTLSDVTQSLTALKNNAISAIIPLLTEFLNIIIENLPLLKDMVNQLTPILVQLVQTVLPFLLQLAQTLLPPIFTIINALMPVLNQIIAVIMPPFMNLLNMIMPLLISLVESVLPIITPLLDMVGQLLIPIIDTLTPIFDLLTPFIDAILSVANVLVTILKPAFEGIIWVLDKVLGGIKAGFETMVDHVKKPINKVIDVINKFIKGLNGLKAPDWIPLIGGKSPNIPLIKKLRVGMEYVPYDEMPALLHKGEQVLSKEEAFEYRNNKGTKQETKNITYNNTIRIDKVEVREEEDIQRIAEELYYLQMKAEV